MRNVTFYINDYEYFSKTLKAENPGLTDQQITEILNSAAPFVAVYTISGNGYSPDKYQLTIDGKTVYINALNGYERGILNDCMDYFMGRKSDLKCVVKVEETEDNARDYTFEYMLLDRLKQDCEYFLGNGSRMEKYLWAGAVRPHIDKMRELYNLLPEKPEWLTEKQINEYARRMGTE